jgi:hypothetical protein
VIGLVSGERAGGELEHRVGHVVDGNDVNGRRATGRDRGIGAARKRLQWRVEDVEGVRPTRRPLSDDDAGAEDLDGKVVGEVVDEPLGLELGALIGVSESLSHLELVLSKLTAMIARDVGRREI